MPEENVEQVLRLCFYFIANKGGIATMKWLHIWPGLKGLGHTLLTPRTLAQPKVEIMAIVRRLKSSAAMAMDGTSNSQRPLNADSKVLCWLKSTIH
ncbi:unnamed protein product [Cylicocyclus nassatus]|uniref:Uncharacterized protein n=1 Tax=Cylicocyclus nassatus TaxID=53992 RepID=A0AA36MAK6_CYLNA|nr:unnamed protein product [Cylicocyclus nassatus]